MSDKLYRSVLVHQVSTMALADSLSVLLPGLFLFLYLSHNVLPIDECLEATHSCFVIQWEDIFCLNRHVALIRVCLKNNDLGYEVYYSSLNVNTVKRNRIRRCILKAGFDVCEGLDVW